MSLEIHYYPIENLIECNRNPRKNDIVVNRMCASIREFGLHIPIVTKNCVFNVQNLFISFRPSTTKLDYHGDKDHNLFICVSSFIMHNGDKDLYFVFYVSIVDW